VNQHISNMLNNDNIIIYYILVNRFYLYTFISPAVHFIFFAVYLTASLIDKLSHESLNLVTSDDAKR